MNILSQEAINALHELLFSNMRVLPIVKRIDYKGKSSSGKTCNITSIYFKNPERYKYQFPHFRNGLD